MSVPPLPAPPEFEPANPAVIVIKFQEAVRLEAVFDSFQAQYTLPEGYWKYVGAARNLYGVAGSYVPDSIAEFWRLLVSVPVRLERLYAATPPDLLLGLVQRARRRLSQGADFDKGLVPRPALQSANPFTYFRVLCPAAQAKDLVNALQAFTPAQNGKPPLLELAYWRGTFTAAAPPVPPAGAATDYMTLLDLAGADQTPYPAPANLHIIDMGWQTHPAFLGRVDLVQQLRFAPVQPVPPGPCQHGCWVLGVLVAGRLPFRGVVRQATMALYSAYSGSQATARIDDALAHAFFNAAPGEVVLIELALTDVNRFDQAFGGPGASFPVETDQACYDLIWLAVNEVGLTVVEPAGNSSLSLDELDRKVFAPQRINAHVQGNFGAQVGAGNSPFAGADLIQHHPRYLIDGAALAAISPVAVHSGAILVGAAVRQNANWQNGKNYGSRVDCLAPGQNLLTTDTNNGQNPVFGQTSGATALMAGLLMQVHRVAGQKNRPLTPDRLRRVLRKQSGIDLQPVTQTGPALFPDFQRLCTELFTAP